MTEVCKHFKSTYLTSFYYPGKFEEREDRVPKLETLNSLGCMSSMNLVLTKQGLLHMELLLLETFQWNLYLPTAAHFIEYYLPVAVNETDLHDGWPMACMEKTMLYMSKYADYFLEVSLQGVVSSPKFTCIAFSPVVGMYTNYMIHRIRMFLFLHMCFRTTKKAILFCVKTMHFCDSSHPWLPQRVWPPHG